ncbi:MAG: type VI secretion system protein TssA [Gammaproteobacteria bacterium]|jgi:type VI secretion system protein ImpA|nr:type VI secretion system protein TssA [Gammaproteobacteria bacterium]
MGSISTDSLLEPVSPDSPCGPDLEYSGVMELERLAQGKPERQFGDALLPPEEPDWVAVGRMAADLAGQTKDLRVLLKLTQALIRTEGFAGLGDGLALIRGTAERYWDCFYPPIDPDDGDPTLRVNTLLGLCDPDLTLKPLREAPLVRSKSFGRISMRDVAIVAGTLPPPTDREAPTATTIDGAFREVELEALRAAGDAIRSAADDLRATEALFTEQVGTRAAIGFDPLRSLLREADKIMTQQIARRGGDAVEESGAGEPEEGAEEGAGGGASGAVRSREDVVRLLDRICEYYRAREPSSPVPLLLERAKRLAYMDFLAIVQDLAPAGLAEVNNIRGPVEE